MSSLDATRIAALLGTERYGRSLSVLASTASTNDDARAAAASGAVDGHVVTADAQHAGRGSHGRSWASPPGTDLYVSILDRPRLSLQQLPPLTLAVGLAVADTVQGVLDARGQAARAQIKWPNDVWIGPRKCAGILIEATTGGDGQQAVVIGIGLNVNRTQFPDALRDSATSLRASDPHGSLLDREQVFSRLLAHTETRVAEFVRAGAEPIAREVDARLALRGRMVRCGDTRGRLLGVAHSGALRIETAGGTREVIAGRLTPDEEQPR